MQHDSYSLDAHAAVNRCEIPEYAPQMQTYAEKASALTGLLRQLETSFADLRRAEEGKVESAAGTVS